MIVDNLRGHVFPKRAVVFLGLGDQEIDHSGSYQNKHALKP